MAYKWSFEELQNILGVIKFDQEPESQADRLSAAFRLPLEDCRKLCGLLSHTFQSWAEQEAEKSGRRKRFRRKANAIERNWFCYVTGCAKSYGSENALKNHFKHKHKNLLFDKVLAQKHSSQVDKTAQYEGSGENESDEDDDIYANAAAAMPSKMAKLTEPQFADASGMKLPLYRYAPPPWAPLHQLHMAPPLNQPFYPLHPHAEMVNLPQQFAVDVGGPWQRPWTEPIPLDSNAIPHKNADLPLGPLSRMPALPTVGFTLNAGAPPPQASFGAPPPGIVPDPKFTSPIMSPGTLNTGAAVILQELPTAAPVAASGAAPPPSK